MFFSDMVFRYGITPFILLNFTSGITEDFKDYCDYNLLGTGGVYPLALAT